MQYQKNRRTCGWTFEKKIGSNLGELTTTIKCSPDKFYLKVFFDTLNVFIRNKKEVQTKIIKDSSNCCFQS